MLPLAAHRAARLTALQAEDGWLNLVARIGIGPGPQAVGSGPDADIRLPSGPARLGRLVLGDQGFCLTTGSGLQPFVARDDGLLQLRVPPFLLEIHTVDGEPALRVRDLTLPRRAVLRHFPDDPAWIIRADWQAFPEPVARTIGQKGAAETTVSLTHTAQFVHQGQPVTLLATHWKGGRPMFVIRDRTAGVETYAASRFLMGEDMTDDAITLDFNRAFNPPCAFTDFAICPLPPRENVLPFRIPAGELAP